MSWKNAKSSAEEVSTARDGASQLWEVKGTEVSIVSGSDEVETERRRSDKYDARGFRRFDCDD